MKKIVQSKREIHYILLAFIALALLMVVVEVLNSYEMKSIHSITTDIYNHPFAVSNASLNIKVEINKIQKDLNKIATSQSSQEVLFEIIKDINKREESVYKNLTTIEKNILGDEGLALQQQTLQLFKEWNFLYDEAIKLMSDNKISEAVILLKDNRLLLKP